MSEPLETTGVLGWLTNARLVWNSTGLFSQFEVIEIIFHIQYFIDTLEFKYKERFHHLIILTVSKYCRFYDELPPWQPQMHGQPLYNSY